MKRKYLDFSPNNIILPSTKLQLCASNTNKAYICTPIHQNLYAWLAIFVLPINSALNPVLYTLTTTIFKKQMSKMIHSCWNKRKRCDHQTASESALSLSLGGGTQSSSLLASKNSWKRSTAV
ncbi:unnamed protein product [Callosobruchus maculatus]|uniref:G-protein coupled receptors family 1 profile domain-containing protein n=1 Tax=Callosobruchus maculatus TaxID=64391 RepID=A0A653DSX2_CALMS|nr:unnamed protein product [Callosobruchus maculatus]